MLSGPDLLGMEDLALRVLPAVTWLAVYRWLQLLAGHIMVKLCVIFGRFFIDISGFINSFGPASCLPQGIISLHPWNAAGPPGKFMCQRFSWDKGSRMHGIMFDFIIWGRLTRPPPSGTCNIARQF